MYGRILNQAHKTNA